MQKDLPLSNKIYFELLLGPYQQPKLSDDPLKTYKTWEIKK
jgi:hypothetical protein